MSKIVSATAVKQGVVTAGGIGTDFVAMNIINEMMFIAPFQTPFLNYLFMNKSIKWSQTAHPQGLCEIIERELTPNTDTIVSVSGSGATLTIVGAEPNLYRVGTSIKFAETDETGIVTTNTAGVSFIVTRDPDTTNTAQNWTAPSVGSTILLLGSAHGENDSPPTNVYVNPYLRKTRVQLFQETIKMTDMMVASTMAGGTRGGDYWNQQMKDTSAKMKIDIENAMVMNENHFVKAGGSIAIGTAGGETLTKTEGAFYQIANNGGTVLQYGASADKSDIKSFFRSMKYGSKKKTFFVGSDLMNDIEDAIEDRIIFNQPLNIYSPIGGDDVINVFRWRTNNLVVDIIRNPQWVDKYSKWGMLLDDGYVQGYHFAPDKKGSRKFRLEMGIESNGQPREEAQLLAHVGIGIECAPCHGIMKP
jgi:hypothetical protein